MADNYLEKKFESVAEGRKAPRQYAGLEALMKRNRSYREYDTSYVVSRFQLEAMVRMNRYLASGRNAQSLRFRLLTKGGDTATKGGADSQGTKCYSSEALQGLYHLGRALPELNLPRKGAEPEAFIVICSSEAPRRNLWIDLGICCEGMLLKAADMGLQGVIICNFNPSEVKAALNLPLDPLCIIAVGKGLEKIELVDAAPDGDLNYYRRDGVHFVPKLPLEALII